MRCIETTQCVTLSDCSRTETCQTEMNVLDPASLGIVEALAECRVTAPCGCVTGPATIQCGGSICSAYQPPPPDPIAAPCCAGGGTACGLDPERLFGSVMVDCVELGQPGVPHASCPAHEPPQPPYDGTSLPGCCRPDGSCGLQDDITGLGCIEASLFGIESTPTCQ